MVQLSDVQKSQLRRRYEKLDARHARGLPTQDARLQRLTTGEIRRIFEQNAYDPQRWPTHTDLEDHLRNIATLRSMGYNAPV
jgi:hypothetical protein